MNSEILNTTTYGVSEYNWILFDSVYIYKIAIPWLNYQIP